MIRTYTTIGVRVALIVGVVLLLGILVVLRDSIGITFATGGLNLKIDSYSVYNGVVQPASTWTLKNLVPGVDKFFNFDDIKPGDRGKEIISFHTDKNAWACMDFSNLLDVENGNNEPESLADLDGPLGGELSKGIEFFSWIDDGDNTYEVGEKAIFGTSSPQAGFDVLKKYILADSTTGNYFPANATRYVGIEWCAGDLTVNTSTAVITCDGTVLGNGAQTDAFSIDLALRAVTANDSPYFRCDGATTTPTVTLNLEKKFSGPVPPGYLPQQFTFQVVGSSTNQIVTLTPYTQDSANGTIQLPKGTYTITEIGPTGFVPADWRPGWYGECKKGTTFSTTITIDNSNINDGTLYCQVDNQYRPKKKGNNGHGNEGDGNDNSNPGNSNNPNDNTDDDGVPPGQQRASQKNQTSQVVVATSSSQSTVSTRASSLLDRLVQSVRNLLRR